MSHPIEKLNRTELLITDMVNKNYTVICQPYAFGQIRIQLTDLRNPDNLTPEGHGTIVSELDTYKVETASKTLSELYEAEEPEQYCVSLEQDCNCEISGDGPIRGDRIRLDETPQSNPYRRCQKQAFPIVNIRSIF